ncbi:hypothetical protein SSX86_014414 [Deinandra increscens subsp. villosa]|uniref:SAP domain-containing protein n=1 Tax=Deinandra increscens subsp. villosa TaxID=3103831 RepID=A0AAP0D9E4_9ASTR
MVVVKPDVIVIFSDEEDDGDGVINLYEGIESQLHGDVNHDAIVISSDDEDDGDGDRNLDEGLDSEHDGDYSELAGIELDKEEEDDVEKSKEEEFVDSCDKRRDRSDSLNEGGNDLQELSLYECKTYLRKHGMRVSGTKEECVQRIKEHGRLKDGSFESLYPRSSFSINCTGDACRGDVVLFKQKMYDSQRNTIGRRTVAGRVVKESYGASTQQHTFSIEVLWSKWFKELNPLSILLIKGRNLYRFGTFRQPWKSEAERSKVLREKHERGRVARHKRKLRETELACGDTKGTKRRKVSHRGPSQIDKHNDENNNTTADNQAVRFQNSELEKALPLTCHSEPNPSMYFNNHLQEASLPFAYDGTLLPNNLPPFSFSSYNHCNNEQGPNQALSQPPDHHHDNKPPTRRLTDGMAKSRFPKSSFSINCTGDARVGDTVLFKQHVYLGGTKMKKKRTVTGRIVNMRECGSKDKHKFLIKVLWATASKKLHRRFTLLVRSHNLYKFGTFRQPRKNEACKSKRFKEKHAQAKHKQKLRKTDIASNKNKGTKRQKGSHKGPSSSKQPTQIAKPKSSKRKGASANAVKETKTEKKEDV